MLKVISKNIIGIEAADVSNFLINGFCLTWGDNCSDATSIPQTQTDRWVGWMVLAPLYFYILCWQRSVK